MATVQERLDRIWATPPGIVGRVAAVNHRVIGVNFIAVSFVFFLLAGLQALLMRGNLATSGTDFLGPEFYNQMFTMHGTTMMFLVLVPMLEGIAIYVLPLMFGARDMPFPRLNAFGFWAYFFGALLLYSSFLVGAAPDSGWFAYVPLTGPLFSPDRNLDFWLLGVTFIEISGIVAAIELIVLIMKQRAAGMSLGRMPLFAWSVLVTSLMIILAFPAIIAASVMLELDRKFGMRFYDVAGGGDPLLWQHLFWIFGHPEVYIQLLPAVGIVTAVVATFTRTPIAGYFLFAAAIIGIGFLSFGTWVHHMFAVGILLLPLAFFSAASQMFAVLSGIHIFSLIATIWQGRVAWKPPFMFALGFIVTFVVGGVTGIMVAVVPFNWQVHDTFFIVAHFHYVLIGGVVFPIFAGLHYWFPKITGRMLDDRLGHWSFWLSFIGFNVAFFPMHILGLIGMPRRIYTYLPGLGWDALNIVVTVGAVIMALGTAVFVWNVVRGLRGPLNAPDNPWDAGTLEWATSSPPPSYNFRVPPSVRSRHPLWDSRRDEPADPDMEEAAQTLSVPYKNRRETMTTTVSDAWPEHVSNLPGPTRWPLVVAFGVLLMIMSLLFDITLNIIIVASLGLAVTVIGFVGWTWPRRHEWEAVQEDVAAKGIRARPEAASPVHSTIWWGSVLALAVVAAVLGFFLFGYYLIRNGAPEWPPAGIPRPGLVLPVLVMLVLLAIAPMVYFAERAIRRGSRFGLALGLMITLPTGLLALTLQWIEFMRQPFTPQTNAYGSLFYVNGGAHSLLLVVAIALTGMVLARTLAGHFTEGHHQAVQSLSLFWYFIAGAWFFVGGTLHLVPYLWP